MDFQQFIKTFRMGNLKKFWNDYLKSGGGLLPLCKLNAVAQFYINFLGTL